MNITQLKKEAKKSWRQSYLGKELLGDLSGIGEKELPYYVLKEHIERLKNLSLTLNNDSFRFSIVNQQLIEAQLLFIFRYQWEYGDVSYPFTNKWIYRYYTKLLLVKNLSDHLTNYRNV